MPFKTTLYQILLPALLLSSVTVGAQTDIVQQGWDLERTGRFKEAYDVFVKAINQYPDSSRAWKGKADMELKVMGDTLAALKDYDRAIELKPKAVWAFFARGQIKYRRKEYTAALDDFNKAIDLKQDNWEFYSYRGVSKSFLKDYEGAIKDYTMAIHLGHRDASLYYDRANEYCWLKQFDKAMADCDTAIEINHSYSAAKDLKQRAQNAKSGKGNFTDNSNLIVNMNLVAASSESTVDTGQVFKVAYSIHVNGTDLKSISLSGIKPPSFNGLIIIAGPNQHTTPRFVKGGIIDSVSYDYVLEANGGGSIIIDAASIDVQGKTYTSSPLAIKVIPGSYKGKDRKELISAQRGNPARCNLLPDDTTRQRVFTEYLKNYVITTQAKASGMFTITAAKTTVEKDEEVEVDVTVNSTYGTNYVRPSFGHLMLCQGPISTHLCNI